MEGGCYYMCKYLETEQKQQKNPQPVRKLGRSDNYRGGAEAEFSDCSLNFTFNANISKDDSLMPAVREAIKGMHPDNICGQPLHGPNDNWALTIETYGSIQEKGANTYAFSATPELIIGGPAGVKISELPNTVQEAYDGLKAIDETEQVDFGANFSKQIIEKIKKDRSKRRNATAAILSISLPGLSDPAQQARTFSDILQQADAFSSQAPPETEEECAARSQAISLLRDKIKEQQCQITEDRKKELQKQQAEIKNSEERCVFRRDFNNTTKQMISPLKQLDTYLSIQDATTTSFSKQLAEIQKSNPDALGLSFPSSMHIALPGIPETASAGTYGTFEAPQTGTDNTSESAVDSDIHAITAPLAASFTKSLKQMADKEMMVQVTLGIPLQMFDAASKALINEDTASDKPGILDDRNYHSKSTIYPDISKDELTDEINERHLSCEPNALNGLLHIINAYRRGFNNVNPQKGPKHEMVLVNKNPLPDIIKSLDEPENYDKWITLCAELIADDFIKNDDREVSWTGGSFTVSIWKNTLIQKKIDLMAVYEKAYRHGQVGGLPELNSAEPYGPVGVYEFRYMPNRTLPMLKTIFEKLASNIDNFE